MKKINKARFILTFTLLTAAVPCINVNASTTLTTGAEVNINNLNVDIDYKLTSEELEDVHDTLNSYTKLKSLDRDESDLFMTTNFLRNTADIEYYAEGTRDAETWLIEHNIYSRPVKVDLNKLSVTKLYNNIRKDYELARKSDFMMMLYKAEAGVIQSNIASISNVNLKRKDSATTGLSNLRIGGPSSISNYWDEGVDAKFGSDNINYVSANVYELYLEQMLNAGIITPSELGSTHGIKLKDDLFNKDLTPKKKPTGAWRRNAINYFNGGSNCLGYANTITNGTVIEGIGKYFTDEKVTMLEAMHYIAEFMRKYENISNTEADMIAYKYGLTEFAGVPQEYLEDIYYLVGAGIISFDGSGPKYFMSVGYDENGNIVRSNTNYLKQGDMYDLLYRVANKGARYDFNIIQLTDAETILKGMGFSKNDYTYMTPKAIPLEMSKEFKDAKEKEKEAKKEGRPTDILGNTVGIITASGNNLFSKLFSPITTFAADETKEYTVTKQFDFKYNGNKTGNIYKYHSPLTQKTYTISDDTAEGCFGNEKVQEELAQELDGKITTSFIGNSKTKKGYDVYTVKFKVHALNKAAALKYVNQNIIHTSYSNAKHSIEALSKVELDGSETTMISQSSLKGISEIVVLHDRVLMNKKTGAKCLIQNSLTKLSNVTNNTQYGYAIIGSQILSGEPIMIEGQDDSVYYNIKCILALLPESSYGSLGFGNPGKVNNTLLGISLHKEFTGSYTYGMLNQDKNNFTYIKINSKSQEVLDDGDAKVAMYNMTNLYKGMTTLTRTFSINFPQEKSGKSKAENITFILDLAYRAPDSLGINITEDKTVDDYQLELMEPPKKEDNLMLYHYWRRNYAMSNALCNMLYGTKDVVYVRSGYFVPKLTILLPKSFKTMEKDGIPYYKMFSKNATEIKKLEKTQVYKTINTFMFENLHFSDEYSIYLPKSTNNNPTIDGWWTTYYSGKTNMKKQFENLLGDSDLAEEMAMLYYSVNAASIEVAIATSDTNNSLTQYVKYINSGSADTVTSTNLEGKKTTVSKATIKEVPYAALTDCNILYRNIAYPKTIAQQSGGASALRVTWKQKSNKTIDKVVVLNESSETKANSTAPRTGELRALTKVYRKGSAKANKYAAFKYSTSSDAYVLSQNFAPAMQSTCSGRDSNDIIYLGTSSELVAMNKKGSSVSAESSNKDLKTVYCIWNSRIRNQNEMETIRSRIIDFQRNIMIPDTGEVKLPKCSTSDYGQYMRDIVYAEYGDFTQDNRTKQKFAMSYDKLKTIVSPGKDFDAAYVYKDIVIFARYHVNTTKPTSDFVVPTVMTSAKVKDIFDISSGGNKVKSNYKSYQYFAALKGYVDKSRFYIDTNKENTGNDPWPSLEAVNPVYSLHKNITSSLAMSQEFYSTALNDQVIKATIASNLKLTDVEEIPNGARLHIGETVWIKNGEYWDSLPINVAKGGHRSWKKTLVKNNFSADSCFSVLCNIWSGYFIHNDNKLYLLKNYVDKDSTDIGTGLTGKSFLELNNYTKAGVLAKTDEDTVVVYTVNSSKDGVQQISYDGPYKYITLKFKFQEGKKLKALVMNTAKTEYELMFDADAYSTGTDLAIFTDELDFKYDSDINVSVTAKDEEMSDALQMTHNEFKGEFTKTVAYDWYRWIRFFTLIATCWLFFMLWFSFIILQRGIGYKFLETLAKPGFRNKGKGLDVIKVMTFGILNIDSQPTINQMAMMTAILILIDVIVGYVL